MSRILSSIRPQDALQSYLDDLLQEATETLDEPEIIQEPVIDEGPGLVEFLVSAADVHSAAVAEAPLPKSLSADSVAVTRLHLASATPKAIVPGSLALSIPTVSEPLIIPAADYGPPAWSEASFECLLFDVAGLKLAVPLICLGAIHSLEGAELTPLFGQPDWFLGILPGETNLKVVDTARWLMDERYRDDYRQGLRYLISIQGYQWGLAVHQVSHSIHLNPRQIKWRTERNKRPWLAGTVIEQMCALLDVEALAALISEKERAPRHANKSLNK